MEKERLVGRKAEIKAQIQEIEGVYTRLEDRDRKKDQAAIESVGYQMHNLYCAFEDLFKIVAETFENQVQDKSKYHMGFLKRMTLSIEGVRPPLMSQGCFLLLNNLRYFRHFFRHAYSYELDKRKVRIVLADALTLRGIYRNDIDAFLNSFE